MARLDGYVASMEYVHNYCREMSPSALNFVLAIQGIEPVRLDQGFSCCDLGCGHGLSSNIFAACHPEGEFHAIDFNPSHILGARDMARQARLANVTFWEASFGDLAGLPLPLFDFITLHGVYSWVSADNRKLVVEFISRNLKAGGVVYLSYNSLPGWASLAPVRQLLVSLTDMSADLGEEQINGAIDFVSRLSSMNLSYFNNNPSAFNFFDELCKRSRNYLAHEYFNEHWVQFYHADVVKDLVQAGVAFVGSATLGDNLDFLNFSPMERQLLAEIDNPVVKETVKDFSVNQQFRRDVFIKGRNKLDQLAQQELFSEVRFTLVVLMELNLVKLDNPRGDVNLDPVLYKLVLSYFNKRDYSLEELLRQPDIALFGQEDVRQAIMLLIDAGYLLPAISPSVQLINSVRIFNYAVLEQTAFDMEPKYLVSPVVRSGIRLDWVPRLLLLGELTDVDDPLSFISSIMREYNYALIKDGEILKSWDENIEELELQIRAFQAFQLPQIKRLGVI